METPQGNKVSYNRVVVGGSGGAGGWEGMNLIKLDY